MESRAAFFQPREIPAGPVVLAVSLDRKNAAEHVLLGEEDVIRKFLEGTGAQSPLREERLPLGTLLFGLEGQSQEEWVRKALQPLKEAAQSLLHRKEWEQKAWQYLGEKQNSHDFAACFAACRCWQSYLRCRNVLGGSAAFEAQTRHLIASFGRPLLGPEPYLDPADLPKGRKNPAQARIWYSQRGREYLVLEDSLDALVPYYASRGEDWGYVFCRCAHCGRSFPAPSRHHSLCSPQCHRAKARESKRRFDAQARDCTWEVDYKNISQRMRNRLVSLRGRDVPEEELEAAEERFAEFRKEAVARKKKLTDPQEGEAFRTWLLEQERSFTIFCRG